MRLKISIGRALLVAASLGAPFACFASDGTITIQGTVMAETCTTIASTAGATAGPASFTVALPNISTSELTATNQTAGRTGFALNLSGCATVTNGTKAVTAFFEHGTNVNSQGRLTVTGASGFEIELLNSAGTVMQLNAVSGQQNSTSQVVASNAATLQYYAQYRYVGPSVTNGAWNTTVSYVIVYP
jgi:major type 1 subunit fimbrin (pilin)